MEESTLNTFHACKRSDRPNGGVKAGERTNYPNPVVEMALAYAIGDKVEASYRRGDLFAKRARLIADWAKFCSQPTVRESKDPGSRLSRIKSPKPAE